MMSHACIARRVPGSFYLHRKPEQGKKAVITHAIIVRRYPIVVEKLLIQEVAVQRPLNLPGKLPGTMHALRQNLLFKGTHLQVYQRALPLLFIVAVPFLTPFQIAFLIGIKGLLLCQFPQNLSLLCAYFVLHKPSP